MTHVDEKNWALVQFDILAREIITSSFTKNCTRFLIIALWSTGDRTSSDG